MANYIIPCISGAEVLVEADSAAEAESAWDTLVSADEAEPRRGGAREATEADVDYAEAHGHDYR